MQFTKIKDNGKAVTLEWLTPDDENPDQKVHHKLVSKDRPLPAFGMALNSLSAEVVRLLRLDPSAFIGLKVTGVSLSPDDDDRITAVVTAEVKLYDVDVPWIINTPALREPDPDSPAGDQFDQRFERALLRVSAAAGLYLVGQRAQGELPLQAPKETVDTTTGEIVEEPELATTDA